LAEQSGYGRQGAMKWSPGQYQRFAEPRLRAGLDLLARLPELPAARRVVDLGCGTGDLTALLAARYPTARTVGLDSSEEMLVRARVRQPQLELERRDIAAFASDEPCDVLFSNAALHWVPDHATLLPRLCRTLAPGGVLAVQVPNNFAEPSHVLLREVAHLPDWKGRVHFPEQPVLPVETLYDVVAPQCRELELWETTYLHLLEGEDPVLEWVKGSAFLPVTEALDPEEQDRFSAQYRRRLRDAYPRRKDGRTLFPFRRLFLLARG
jgi:trans-aconitate 2-methyltransferase